MPYASPSPSPSPSPSSPSAPRRRRPHRDRDRDRHRIRARDRDRGQVAIEYLGFLPILLLVALGTVQLGLIAYAGQQAGTAARAGARAASLDLGAQQGCTAAVSDWLDAACSEGQLGDEVEVTATVDIPSLVPGWDFGPATRTAVMPIDHTD